MFAIKRSVVGQLMCVGEISRPDFTAVLVAALRLGLVVRSFGAHSGKV